MPVPIKFFNTPPSYSGYWYLEDPSSGRINIKYLISVKSGRMYLCTSIPENTLPAMFFLSDALNNGWYKAFILANESLKIIDNTGLRYTCVFTRHKGRLSIHYDGSTYPLYWKQTNMTELHLLELF